MTKSKLALAGLVLIILMVPTAFANPGVPSSVIDLEASFTGFEAFLTDLTSEVDANMLDIANLQGNQTAIQTDIAILQGQIAVLSAGGPQGTNTALPMTTQASTTGAINPQKTEFIFYGDTLCEIEASGYVVIEFGGDTLVKHNNNCSALNGDLINLNTAIDESFKQGDILVLDRVSSTWDEVFRSQTP